MYTSRTFKVKDIIGSSFVPILIFVFYSGAVVAAYELLGWHWLKVPWVPMTMIGTALAFYLGFKNNSAYDRTWEARKIWGAIVNSSRSWGLMVRDFITDEFTPESVAAEELEEIHKRIVYRHIAWLYRLKRQLRVLKPWEHDVKLNEQFRVRINTYFPKGNEEDELKQFLSDAEVQDILTKKNPATQLIAKQSAELKLLKRKGYIDDFRHMELQKMLTDFYTQQGKAERIKNFPLPRQYATISIYFVVIFTTLLPLGLLSAFDGFGEHTVWGVIPFTVLVAWVFWIMEMVGDYAENPFENLMFDIPMDALTRTIEIDMREMIGETDLPNPITPIENFVM